LQKSSKHQIKQALASLDVGLAVEELDFLGNLLFEDSPDFIDSGDDLFSTMLIFRTQEDAKVDDKICLPLQNQEFEFDDPLRPVIPDDTHPNCRCYWENADTGENLGQDGAFATATTATSITKVTTVFADTVDGKEGAWKTIKGTPVFFPDGEDPSEVINKAFKDKPKTSKPKEHKSLVNPEGDPLTHDLSPDMDVEALKESSRRNGETIKEHQKRIQESIKFSEIDYSTTGMSEREVQQGIKETFDPHEIAFSEDMEFQHSEEDLKGMWKNLGDENQDLRDRFVEIERGTVRGNEETRQLFEKSPTFFRGTDPLELDDMIDDGIMGSSKLEFEDPDEGIFKYDFTAVTPHEEISGHYGNGVTIEFDGDSVRKHGKPVEYSPFWRDFGAKSETIDGGMHIKYMDHNEVRMPREIPLDDMKIKNIFIDDWVFHAGFTEEDAIEKYSKLGNVVIRND
jgi:hypothetical protein